MERPIVSLRSPKIEYKNSKIAYSESIFHADFKSKKFVSEYLPTTSEKLYMKINFLYYSTTSLKKEKKERDMLNLKRLLGKISMKNAITWYLYQAFCMLISSQESSSVNIQALRQEN